MVIVKDFHLRQGDKTSYVSLELEGDLELIQSQNTGRFYATTRRCFIYSTFDEDTAARMVGSEIPGSIVRVPCDVHEYTVPETNEVLQLNFRWDYIPEEISEIKSKKKSIPITLIEYPRS